MGNLPYIIAGILIIVWAIGFIGFNLDGLIHAPLIVAAFALILKKIDAKSSVQNKSSSK